MVSVWKTPAGPLHIPIDSQKGDRATLCARRKAGNGNRLCGIHSVCSAVISSGQGIASDEIRRAMGRLKYVQHCPHYLTLDCIDLR